LNALLGVAQDLVAAAPDVDLTGLVAELQRRQDAQHAPIASGVTLTTLHAAKGLEWSTVFLVGMHEGTLPIVYATTPAAVEEERRLLYVGVTRARDALHVSWAAARSPGGRSARGPSRFLHDLLGDEHLNGHAHQQVTRRRRTRGAKMATCRMCSRPLTDPRERKLGRCLGCPSSYDEALHATLREWRRQRAAAEKVPAYCVFTDATLTALAEMVPSDNAALARVPGIGAAKVEKYGDDLLALCATPSAQPGELSAAATET
jgi:DNA helicase-2/ATP-dependent DNA helicase PcrA